MHMCKVKHKMSTDSVHYSENKKGCLGFNDVLDEKIFFSYNRSKQYKCRNLSAFVLKLVF